MKRIGTSDLEDAVWTQAQTLEKFTTADLCRFGISDSTAREYCRRWQKAGRVRVAGTEGRAHVYAPVSTPKLDDSGVPIVPTPEGNMWRTMRQLGQFSPTDVAAHSNVGGISVEVKTAQAYCRDLLNARYLSVRVKARPGLREAVYKLVNDTGPVAPVLRRVSGIFDPNTDQFIPNLKEGAPWQRF